MKKLNSINWVSFKEDGLYLEDISIGIGINIDEWLTNSNNLEIELEIAKYDEKREYIEFVNYPSISISTYNKTIESINIYPYEYQTSPYFKGDIFIFYKKLEVPFKSDDIESIFQL